MSELHGLVRGKACSVGVDAPKGVVHDGARAAVPLRNDAHGRELEAGKMLNEAVREHSPVPFADHVRHFRAKEGGVLLGGAMAAALQGVIALGCASRSGVRHHRSAVALDVAKEVGGMVW